MEEEAFLEQLKSSLPTGKDIIERTMMQKIVFRIHPSGQVFIVKEQCQTWFTDQKQIYKKKEKKKANPVAETKIENTEEY